MVVIYNIVKLKGLLIRNAIIKIYILFQNHFISFMNIKKNTHNGFKLNSGFANLQLENKKDTPNFGKVSWITHNISQSQYHEDQN
jgi:hypothetical protein